VPQVVWAKIQTIFEIEYKAKATTTSIVAKSSEVRQAADETVNNYFSRVNKILWELSTSQRWFNQEVRNIVVSHVGLHAVSRNCEQ
jgi:hypothetical protein